LRSSSFARFLLAAAILRGSLLSLGGFFLGAELLVSSLEEDDFRSFFMDGVATFASSFVDETGFESPFVSSFLHFLLGEGDFVLFLGEGGFVSAFRGEDGFVSPFWPFGSSLMCEWEDDSFKSFLEYVVTFVSSFLGKDGFVSSFLGKDGFVSAFLGEDGFVSPFRPFASSLVCEWEGDNFASFFVDVATFASSLEDEEGLESALWIKFVSLLLGR